MTIFRGRFGGAVSSNGEQWICTTHVESGGPGLSACLAAFETAIEDLWNAYKSYLLPATTCTYVIVDQLDPTTGKNTTQVQAALTLVGTSADADPAPPQTSIVVSTKTAMATKAGRGRFYLPAPTATHVTTTGEIPSVLQDAIGDAAALYMADLSTAGFQPVVFHRNTVTTDDITSVSVLSIYGTQRRRRNKLIGTRYVVPL